jgi:hypothetical protein
VVSEAAAEKLPVRDAVLPPVEVSAQLLRSVGPRRPVAGLDDLGQIRFDFDMFDYR